MNLNGIVYHPTSRYGTAHRRFCSNLAAAVVVRIEGERTVAAPGMQPFEINFHCAVIGQPCFIVIVSIRCTIGHVTDLPPYAVPFIDDNGLWEAIIWFRFSVMLVEHFVAELIAERAAAALVNQKIDAIR